MNTIYGEDFVRLETQSISIYFLQFSLSIKAATSTIPLPHVRKDGNFSRASANERWNDYLLGPKHFTGVSGCNAAQSECVLASATSNGSRLDKRERNLLYCIVCDAFRQQIRSNASNYPTLPIPQNWRKIV
jgi:hypothetical protein